MTFIDGLLKHMQDLVDKGLAEYFTANDGRLKWRMKK